MADHSPATRAIVAAFNERGLAAALRALADQVVPETECPDTEEWLGQSAWIQAESRARLRLLAIAAELELSSPQG